MKQTHYEVLGAGRDETFEQIAAKYRRLAMQWHPDRYPDASPSAKAAAEERFKDISVAKKVLCNPITRAEYDAFLDASTEPERTEAPEPFTQEASMSRDEAQQMHFADLAAFALTLAAKGWNVQAIADHLMELGCSPSMANALAQSAVDRVDWAEGGPASQSHNALSSLDQATWEEVKPYYRAFIGGAANQSEFTDLHIERLDALRRKRRRLAIGAVGTLSLAGLACTTILGPRLSAGAFISIVISLLILSIVLGLVAESIASLFIADRSRYLGEKTIRFYLRHFEQFHTKRSGHIKNAFGDTSSLFFVGPISWFAYRRMPGLCVVFIFVWAIVVLIIDHLLDAMAVPARSQYIPFLGLNAAFMTLAPRIYYFVARRRIRALVADSRQDILGRIARAGGTNRWSWMPAIVFAISLMTAGDVLVESKFDSAVASQPTELQTQAATTVAAAVDDPAESRARQTTQLEVDAQNRYDEVVKNLEAQYPRLNPDSPQYDRLFVANILQRKKTLMASGMPADNALVLAVSAVVDSEVGQVSQQGLTNGPRRPVAFTDDQSTRLTHTTSAQNQQIICESFPSSCRQ